MKSLAAVAGKIPHVHYQLILAKYMLHIALDLIDRNKLERYTDKP